MEGRVSDLAEQMRVFLKKGERVLICLGDQPGSAGELFKLAVIECGAEPVVWKQDFRWKNLLRLAFIHKVRTIISVPMLVLGLAKLARAKATPLYVHNVVTVGYPCEGWVREGIVNGLDCNIRNWEMDDPKRLMNLLHLDPELRRLGAEIMEWTSVLDCWLHKGDAGLEIEIVVFPGEKLPKLPTCAKLVVRPWEPETDVPFEVRSALKNAAFSGENH